MVQPTAKMTVYVEGLKTKNQTKPNQNYTYIQIDKSIYRLINLRTMNTENYISSTKYCLYELITNELHHEKAGFLCMRKAEVQISCPLTAQLISTFVFTTLVVQSLYFLNPKFQASNHLLWLHSQVCVKPDQKHQRQVFS